jgi:hypothetical protein
LAIGMFLTVYPARPASGQVLYGSMVGTVTDQSGAMVPTAAVTVTNTSTGLSRQTTTNEAGYYSIPNLPEGGLRPFGQRRRLQTVPSERRQRFHQRGDTR